MKIMQLPAIAITLAVGVALTFAGCSGKDDTGPATSSTRAENADQASTSSEIGGRYIMRTDMNQIVTDESFQGRFVLMTFGYTYCPDICPTNLSTLATTMDLLGNKAADVQVVFVSVDPKRDTPAVLHQYVTSFDPGFVGLTGSAASIQSMTKKFHVRFIIHKPEHEGDDNYTVDHTASIFLMGPDGKFIRRFSHISTPEEIAKGVETAMEHFTPDPATEQQF